MLGNIVNGRPLVDGMSSTYGYECSSGYKLTVIALMGKLWCGVGARHIFFPSHSFWHFSQLLMALRLYYLLMEMVIIRGGSSYF